MSLFSTIAHPETPHVKGFSRRGFEIALVVLALLVLVTAVVYVISNNETTTEQATSPAAVSNAVDDHFLEINTTGFVDLTPAAVVAVDPFMGANVVSMDELATLFEARQIRDPAFAEMNVGSYGALESVYEARRVRDPAFAEMNVGSYDWLNEAHVAGTIGPTPQWVQQPSGPR